MNSLRRAGALFHLGLGLFSLPFALILLFILTSVHVQPVLALISAVAVILIFQLMGFLYTTGFLSSSTPLRLSFWTLKILQTMNLIPLHTPEKMVVAMNNRKTLGSAEKKYSPKETLILVPHCLQNHECPIRLTFDPDACKRCGKCPIGGLLKVRDRFGTHFAIASGGTSARRIVKDLRPSLITAVACPVDLSLGILDVNPITTVGVLNQWRSGPCFDTWVDPGELEAALEMFVEEPATDA
ncbi:MAG: DUF116 domain-containing protein [Candidatus Aegiribacteria sp.]|nr:DUF116 domain-containing protein [Candidatus Aegiribacteria sp.]MBD3294765.1 DUF116 domain-containing protein [Candidatus Fermentibacteria bacterium]